MRGKRYAILLEFVNDHLDDFVDVLQSFRWSRTLSYRTKPAQHRAVGVETAFIWLDHYFEGVGLHDVFSVYRRHYCLMMVPSRRRISPHPPFKSLRIPCSKLPNGYLAAAFSSTSIPQPGASVGYQ